MLNRIAHKHASLGVRADLYPLVHQHLFEAIAEVLGDAVTPEVAAAWDEVYWLMANALIAIETRLYAGQGVADGDVWRQWEVVARTEETPHAASFLLRPADGHPAPAFRAGQYVSVQVQLADGARQIRQYSLTGAPSATTRAIAVKQVTGTGGDPDGEVSHHLHTHVRQGDQLRVSAPYGDLVLEPGDAPLLLASAGIGCTPMLAMLEQLVATGHPGPVTVVHADRSPATTHCAPTTRHSRPNSPPPRPTSGTRTPTPATAPAASTSPTYPSNREPAPTSADRCRSCGRCAGSS